MKPKKEPGEALEDLAKGIGIVVIASYGLWVLFCIAVVVNSIMNH